MPIVFFIVGLVYGAIFNFILSGDDATIIWSCLFGLLVGFIAGIIYLVFTFFFGFGFNNKYLEDKLIKTVTILVNVLIFGLMYYGITMIIGNSESIPLEYAWMYIANLLFVGVVIGKINYDGKALRNFEKESEKLKESAEGK